MSKAITPANNLEAFSISSRDTLFSPIVFDKVFSIREVTPDRNPDEANKLSATALNLFAFGPSTRDPVLSIWYVLPETDLLSSINKSGITLMIDIRVIPSN